MPERELITEIPGVKVRHVSEEQTEIIVKAVAEVPPGTCCSRCSQSRVRIKASKIRYLKHTFFARKLVRLKLRVPKLYCKNCHRYFMLPVPGVLSKRRSTESYRTNLFQLHQGGIPQVELSRTHFISGSTVERWYQDFVRLRVQELKGRPCPSLRVGWTVCSESLIRSEIAVPHVMGKSQIKDPHSYSL